MIRLFIISLLALTSYANYSIDRHHVKLGDALNFLPEVIVSETDGNTAGQMVEVTKSVEYLVNNRINLLRSGGPDRCDISEFRNKVDGWPVYPR